MIEVLRTIIRDNQLNVTSSRKLAACHPNGAVFDSQTKTQTNKRKQKVDPVLDVDKVPTNTHSSQGESQLYFPEDNECVINMIINGRSPTMRQVSRTHRVALDWLMQQRRQLSQVFVR